MRPLYRFQSSGRWLLGSQPPKSSRKENTRSFARARSSSRRAPPKAASNLCSAIASSSVTVCSWLREARGPFSSATLPESIDSCTLATIKRSPSSATRRSRNSITSGKLCPVSTCINGNGKGPGRNAFSASRSSTIESLPPLNSSTGRSNSAATSRITWIASDSSARRWLSWGRSATLMTHQRAGRTRSSQCPPSGPHGLCPAECKVRSRSRSSPGRATGCRAARARRCASTDPFRSTAPVGCTCAARAWRRPRSARCSRAWALARA